jgi:hypothetical protein
MKVVDLLGNTIEVGNVVAVKSEHLVGVVIKAEDGIIAKGLSVSGQPRGEVMPQHIVVKIELTTVVPAIGGVVNVLKIAAPDDKKSLIN